MSASPFESVPPVDPPESAIRVIRSPRRRKSAQARALEDGTIVVRVPAGMPPAEEDRIVRRLVAKVAGRDRARRAGGDDELRRRADRLADRWLDGVRPSSVAWSARMSTRWASCSPHDGSIRVSDRLAAVPDWVLDGVLVHELAHLHHADHSPAFHELVDRYPERARVDAFLAGMTHAQSQLARWGLQDPSSDQETT